MQLPAPHGLSRSAIYISTESSLSTTRLTQLIRTHPLLSSQLSSTRPSLERVLSISTPDLESQDHIIQYQLPVACAKYNVGLIILDSVAANYRAEGRAFEEGKSAGRREYGEAMASRSAQLVKLGEQLRDLARKFDLAVVVANQVADRFEAQRNNFTQAARLAGIADEGRLWSSSPPVGSSPDPRGHQDQPRPQRLQQQQPPTSSAPSLPPPSQNRSHGNEDTLSLDHQQRFFTGWGDTPPPLVSQAYLSPIRSGQMVENLKTPSLGLVWTQQVDCRIAVLLDPMPREFVPEKEHIGSLSLKEVGRDEAKGTTEEEANMESVLSLGGRESRRKRRRWIKIAFCKWAKAHTLEGVVDGDRVEEGRGLEIEIWGGGVRSVQSDKSKSSR